MLWHLLYFTFTFTFQRGVGEKAVGTSISLVAPGEDEKKHVNVCRALQGSSDTKKFEEAVIDGHLLRNCQERAALATKIVNYEESEAKVSIYLGFL